MRSAPASLSLMELLSSLHHISKDVLEGFISGGRATRRFLVEQLLAMRLSEQEGQNTFTGALRFLESTERMRFDHDLERLEVRPMNRGQRDYGFSRWRGLPCARGREIGQTGAYASSEPWHMP